MNPASLITASATIIGLLGVGHLILTYWGPKLLPRDRSLRDAMRGVSPVITTQTDIWRMWIGFNSSHAMGAMLFGLVYGYLAQAHSEIILQSSYLQVVGFLMIGGFVVLAKLYWFITPLAGSSVSLVLYVLGIIVARGA